MDNETPLPLAAIRLVTIAKEALAARFEPSSEAFITPHGYAVDAADVLTAMEIDMPTEDARWMLKRELPRMGAVAFVHVAESWAATATTPADVALLESYRGRLKDAPKRLLREVVNIFVETPDMPVRAEEVEIVRAEDGSRTLGAEWTAKRLSYPRPTFRRYFPEARR